MIKTVKIIKLKGGDMKKGIYTSFGNRKVEAIIFNLPSKKTCPKKTSLCSAACYATQAEALYPKCLPCREGNLKESMKNDFVENMTSHLSRKVKSKNFSGKGRIHESGDFYSQAYLDKWKEICREKKEIKFLAFTKSIHLDFSNKPKNMEIIFSIMPDTSPADIELAKDKGFNLAYAGWEDPGNSFHCPGNCRTCGKCWSLEKGESVFFEFHGNTSTMKKIKKVYSV